MATFFDLLLTPLDWVVGNIYPIIFSIIFGIVVGATYRLIRRSVNQLISQKKLEENAGFIIKRFFRWGSYILIAGFVIHQFGFRLDTIGGLLAVAGGTVIGFAAMNTLGNAISGIIIMTSRPFLIGDRLFYNNQFADVLSVDLIYTKLKTLDDVTISVPNQLLLQNQITTYGKYDKTRRGILVTMDYNDSPEKVEQDLLAAAQEVDGVLRDPKPFVWVSNLGLTSVDYTLYFYIGEMKKIPEVEAALRKKIISKKII
jgi:small-conductance mechanosensitive channel